MIKIKIGGWAGQGTVRAGSILGRTLALEQGYEVVQRRSYSAAVRSGIASSDIIADEGPVDEMVVDKPDYLLILYQKTLEEWKDIAENSGHIIVDSSRVHDVPDVDCEVHLVPAGDIAENISTSKAANVVLLGALAGISPDIDLDALERRVEADFPKKYIQMNLKALEEGYNTVNKA